MVLHKCNMCGKQVEHDEFVYEIHGMVGYGSKYDGDMLELDLCVECMDEIIDKCKISPLIQVDDEGLEMAFNQALKLNN